MDFDEENDDIMLLLLVAFVVTSLLNALQRSRQQLMWVKPWLQCRSTKSVYHILTKLQDCYGY